MATKLFTVKSTLFGWIVFDNAKERIVFSCYSRTAARERAAELNAKAK